MKTNKYNCSKYGLILTLVLNMILVGCQNDKDMVKPSLQSESSMTSSSNEHIQTQVVEGRYKKVIDLSDRTGNNKVTIELSSNDRDILADIDADYYTLKPLYDKPVLREEGENEDSSTPKINVDKKVYVKITPQSMEPGVVGFSLVANPSPANGSYGGPVYAWNYEVNNFYEYNISALRIKALTNCVYVNFWAYCYGKWHQGHTVTNLCPYSSSTIPNVFGCEKLLVDVYPLKSYVKYEIRFYY